MKSQLVLSHCSVKDRRAEIKTDVFPGDGVLCLWATAVGPSGDGAKE